MAAGPYNYSYIFKYIIIGDMGVGKSCLLHQFTEKKCKYFTILQGGFWKVIISRQIKNSSKSINANMPVNTSTCTCI